MRWKITVAVWPHSSGNGEEADKKAAGAENGDLYYYVDAHDFSQAVKMAYCYADGVAAHPAVWKAPIMGIHRHD